ncbi:MAG: efflux RND transporter periplasmic adaptor subunit [Candidatus Paceibacterota bacterium]|jgi:HlyD family secretion protein
MRKISYYVIAVVLAGIAVTGFWAYERYFKTAPQPFLYFTVNRGDIQESIRVRSEVVAQKDFELEFPFSGTVETVYVKDGQTVSAGQRLMKLETTDLAIQSSQMGAVVAQRRADYVKLVAGATPQDISVSESELTSAQIALSESETNLIDKIKNAYAKSDDAVRAKTNQLFNNPQSANPELLSTISVSSAARNSLNAKRLELETMLNAWNVSLGAVSVSSDLAPLMQAAEQNTASVSAYLDTLSQAMSNLTASVSLPQATVDAYNTDISTARANMSTAITSLVTAEEKYRLAAAGVVLAEKELSLKRAPARSEDVAIAASRIQEAQDQLASVTEQISKSTLVAPSAGEIVKVHHEVGEVFRPGQSAISMMTAGYKLQADVSELDIAKVNEADGNIVRVALDAFPGRQFYGRVASIDSQAVIKTEDKYYRVNIVFDAGDANIRSGMSADATILSSIRKGVLRVPDIAVYRDGATKYVKLLPSGMTKATKLADLKRVEVQTGITDGEYVEIVSGLQEGQTAVVTAE